jgi:hypothetical protein
MESQTCRSSNDNATSDDRQRSLNSKDYPLTSSVALGAPLVSVVERDLWCHARLPGRHKKALSQDPLRNSQ